MNALERKEWLAAVAACVEGAHAGRMAEAAEALEQACPGRWEASVGGRGPHAAGLRFFGGGDPRAGRAAWRQACAKAFGLGDDSLPETPAEGLPWLEAAWDLKTGRWTRLRLYGVRKGAPHVWEQAPGAAPAAPRRLTPRSFEAGAFGEPALDRALAEFHALCPLSTLTMDGDGWSMRLESPLRWPLFARCEVSAAFTPKSSQLALLLLDRRVTELSFDGEALWAHCAA